MGRSTYSMWITNKIYDTSVYKLLNFIFNKKNKATAETEINLPFGAKWTKFKLTKLYKKLIILMLSGCSEAWYRAWFGTMRPKVQILSLRFH